MSERLSLTLEIPPHFIDHRYMGVPVLPAVASLQALARAASQVFPELDVRVSSQAHFKRFLPLDPDADSAEVTIVLQPQEEGGVRARLLTVKPAGSSGITREVEHVAVTFGPQWPAAEDGEPQGDVASPDEAPFMVAREQLYRDLVPFGPAFRNVQGEIQLWPQQAAARVRCPGLPGSDGLLGSPFPLDAALHVACAWGQRHLGVVLFPVGYHHRDIIKPTEPGGRYWCDVVTTPGAGDSGACFEISIRDEGGQKRERCSVRMEDISRGKLSPPDWVIA